jgi:hypothetical protein
MKLQITINLYDSDDSEIKNIFDYSDYSENKILVKRKQKQMKIIKHVDTQKKLHNKIEFFIPLHKKKSYIY